MKKILICYLIITLALLSFGSNSLAMLIQSPYGEDGRREVDLQKIRKVLELKLVQHKLGQFGLTEEEIEVRLAQLDDEQIHQIASQIDALEAGGNGFRNTMVPVAIFVLAVILAVVFTIGIFALAICLGWGVW